MRLLPAVAGIAAAAWLYSLETLSAAARLRGSRSAREFGGQPSTDWL